MHVIRARNVHTALPAGLRHLEECGQPRPSRAGNVLVSPYPVTTIYECPTERVLFWPERDANPFFHFFEGLAFLAGIREVKFYQRFVRDMGRFSDDGVFLNASYGYRWRVHFHEGTPTGSRPVDQLARVIALLRNHPDTRRAVLTMWDPVEDLRTDEVLRDVPCNTQVLFGTTLGRRDEPNRLNVTVVNRSNDIIWGLYGANAVHMSMMMEYVAANLDLVVGSMTTISNNFHAYEEVYQKTRQGALAPGASLRAIHDASHGTYLGPCPECAALRDVGWKNPYTSGEVAPYPMVEDPKTWDRDLVLFFEDPMAYGFLNPFFAQVAKPLWWGHEAYRRKDYNGALEVLAQCRATDWRRAASEWVERRRAAREMRHAAK